MAASAALQVLNCHGDACVLGGTPSCLLIRARQQTLNLSAVFGALGSDVSGNFGTAGRVRAGEPRFAQGGTALMGSTAGPWTDQIMPSAGQFYLDGPQGTGGSYSRQMVGGPSAAGHG